MRSGTADCASVCIDIDVLCIRNSFDFVWEVPYILQVADSELLSMLKGVNLVVEPWIKSSVFVDII